MQCPSDASRWPLADDLQAMWLNVVGTRSSSQVKIPEMKYTMLSELSRVKSGLIQVPSMILV